MGYRRRIYYQSRNMTVREMEQQNLFIYMLLFIAGFVTFGATWIVLAALFVSNLGNK